MEAINKSPIKLKVLIYLGIILALAILILINWSIYKLLGWFIGSIASFLLLFLSYYYSLRILATMLAFPGITILMKR